MKHQYTYTLFFDVNKTVYEFFSVSHLTEEMVKCYTIQQHLPTITYEFQTKLKYCVQQTNFKYKIHVLAIEVYYIGRNYTHTTYMNVPFYCVQQSNVKYKIHRLATSVLYIGCNCTHYYIHEYPFCEQHVFITRNVIILDIVKLFS